MTKNEEYLIECLAAARLSAYMDRQGVAQVFSSLQDAVLEGIGLWLKRGELYHLSKADLSKAYDEYLKNASFIIATYGIVDLILKETDITGYGEVVKLAFKDAVINYINEWRL